MMPNNIVVPLDGSSYSWSAAHHAIQIAQATQASIHGVSVTDVKVIEGRLLDELIQIVTRSNPHIGPFLDGKVDKEDATTGQQFDTTIVQNHFQDQGQLLLEQLERECEKAGIAYHSAATSGMIPGVICQAARDLEAQLITIGKRGLNAKWSGPLLGSTAESVVRMARRPVLLASETYTPIKHVYLAYDGDLISVRALRFTADLCVRCKWQLSVISVEDSEERREKLLREAAEIAELHNVKITPIGRSGDVVEQILQSTATEVTAPIVLGARAHRLLGLTLGNVAERVMRRAPQPVLLYRPLPE